ncbi:hypothetical protein CSE45_3754 [Citreicella sp. SE45]|nr:hypothetical protein CSE45_3754 [Citreicella sp. SE45]|tara:strand:- start:166 stop:294 length:129 start_codon:yes stop_codon:yes gene_type:complete
MTRFPRNPFPKGWWILPGIVLGLLAWWWIVRALGRVMCVSPE